MSIYKSFFLVRMVNGQHQIRAISDIKAGEEININYHETPYFGLRSLRFRQNSLLFKWFFTCSCVLCQDQFGTDSNAFEVSKIVFYQIPFKIF